MKFTREDVDKSTSVLYSYYILLISNSVKSKNIQIILISICSSAAKCVVQMILLNIASSYISTKAQSWNFYCIQIAPRTWTRIPVDYIPLLGQYRMNSKRFDWHPWGLFLADIWMLSFEAQDSKPAVQLNKFTRDNLENCKCTGIYLWLLRLSWQLYL